MKLQTKIPLKPEPYNQIDYNSNLLLLGSCFVENIGNKFEYFKFQSLQNPFGILYHPKAIENVICKAIKNKDYDETDVFYHLERWHCFDAHSNLSSSDKEELLSNLNEAVKQTNQQIKDASHIIITLGTAWSYRFIETDQIVANCHKISQKKFSKHIQSVNSIIGSLESIIKLLKTVNSEAVIIFTISPVRHLKDGFIENTQSKGHLISAIHQIVELRNNVYYFPSYEIMLDELRDYRFYAEDMIHPNKTAINYIWEKFITVWFSDVNKRIMQKVDAVQKGLNHKPFNSESQQYQRFLEDLEFKKNELQSQFPHIIF